MNRCAVGESLTSSHAGHAMTKCSGCGCAIDDARAAAAVADDGTEPTPRQPTRSTADRARSAPDTSTRAFVKLGWPLFIANLAVVGNGTIDTIMAGRLSATDLAAVAVGSSIYVSVYIGLMGVLQALSPIAGHHFGAQRWRAIGDDLQQALWLSLSWRSPACRSFSRPMIGSDSRASMRMLHRSQRRTCTQSPSACPRPWRRARS